MLLMLLDGKEHAINIQDECPYTQSLFGSNPLTIVDMPEGQPGCTSKFLDKSAQDD